MSNENTITEKKIMQDNCRLNNLNPDIISEYTATSKTQLGSSS